MVKYTKQLLEQLSKESSSICEIARKLGRRTDGNGISYISRLIKLYQIDISHYKGKSWSKGSDSKLKKHWSTILVDGCLKRTASHKLRRALIEIGIEYKCLECGNDGYWNGKKLTLQVDHVDGNPINNVKENLRFLCPNCHNQTETFGSKRLKKVKLRKTSKIRPTKIAWPTREELQYMIWQEPTSNLAKKLGVSDNAITKRCKLLNIAKPGLGYWQKKNAGVA